MLRSPYLSDGGFTDAVKLFDDVIGLRHVLADNCRSMKRRDARRLVDVGSHVKVVDCSRWDEVAEAVRFFSTTAVTASVPTSFHFLNKNKTVTIAADSQDSRSCNDALSEVNNASLVEANGKALLVQHLRNAVEDIVKSADSLKKANKIASLVILTDSEVPEVDAAEILRDLEGFPVVVTVGLLAGSDEIAVRANQYWHGVSARVDIEIHVIEDWDHTACTSYEANEWLTYGLPLHRLRQHGTLLWELYAIDQYPMNRIQMRNICALVFDCSPSDFPNPCEDWAGFIQEVASANSNAPLVWCPRRKREVSWVDISKLDALGATLPADDDFEISVGVDPSQVVSVLNEELLWDIFTYYASGNSALSKASSSSSSSPKGGVSVADTSITQSSIRNRAPSAGLSRGSGGIGTSTVINPLNLSGKSAGGGASVASVTSGGRSPTTPVRGTPSVAGGGRSSNIPTTPVSGGTPSIAGGRAAATLRGGGRVTSAGGSKDARTPGPTVLTAPSRYEKRILSAEKIWEILRDFKLVPKYINTYRFNKIMVQESDNRVLHKMIAFDSKELFSFWKFLRVLGKVADSGFSQIPSYQRLVSLFQAMNDSGQISRIIDSGNASDTMSSNLRTIVDMSIVASRDITFSVYSEWYSWSTVPLSPDATTGKSSSLTFDSGFSSPSAESEKAAAVISGNISDIMDEASSPIVLESNVSADEKSENDSSHRHHHRLDGNTDPIDVADMVLVLPPVAQTVLTSSNSSSSSGGEDSSPKHIQGGAGGSPGSHHHKGSGISPGPGSIAPLSLHIYRLVWLSALASGSVAVGAYFGPEEVKKQIRDYSETTIQTTTAVLSRFQQISVPAVDWILTEISAYKAGPVGQFVTTASAKALLALEETSKASRTLLHDTSASVTASLNGWWLAAIPREGGAAAGAAAGGVLQNSISTMKSEFTQFLSTIYGRLNSPKT